MKEALIGMLLLPMTLLAQQSGAAWTNIGPSPAAVQAIAVDPGGTGTIFMGSIAGGVLKSIDGGTTWSAVNNGLTTLAIDSLAIDASGPQTVYAGSASGAGGGLFKTDDGGPRGTIFLRLSTQLLVLRPTPNGPEWFTPGFSLIWRMA